MSHPGGWGGSGEGGNTHFWTHPPILGGGGGRLVSLFKNIFGPVIVLPNVG